MRSDPEPCPLIRPFGAPSPRRNVAPYPLPLGEGGRRPGEGKFSMKWLSHIGKQASRLASFELFRYIGPGFFVTVGFIDPGNWVTNVAAGSQFGYQLLWVVKIGRASCRERV